VCPYEWSSFETARRGGASSVSDDGSLALSELQQLKVFDKQGDIVGEVADVVAALTSEPPTVSAFICHHDEEQLRVSWSQVATLDVEGERVDLNVTVDELAPASLRSDEIALVDSVLDKQVLDLERRRLVRVQDVVLRRDGAGLTVQGVDTGGSAVLKRVGLGFIADHLGHRTEHFLPWEDVNLISLRLSRPNFAEAFEELADMRPADIAEILHQVGPRERASVLAALNTAQAADTLQEMDESLRGAALAEMPRDLATAVLAEIDPDEAADILAQLPSDVAEGLLATLPEREAASIRGLASYPEHSAGGLMTTDFVVLFGGMTAGEAIDFIRAEKPEAPALSSIFVNDAQGVLRGFLSLRDLVVADPAQRLEEIMSEDPVTVHPQESEEEVGRLMTKYNLLVLPVVDDVGRLLGVVTIDDALDAIVPEEWKAHLPRLLG